MNRRWSSPEMTRTPRVSSGPEWVARERTPAIFHPELCRPACQLGTGVDEGASGEDNPLIEANSCLLGALGGFFVVRKPVGAGPITRIGVPGQVGGLPYCRNSQSQL